MKEGWKMVKLGEVCTIKGGKRLPQGKSLISESTPYRYIRVADFKDNGTVIPDEVLYIDEEVYTQIYQYTISSNDVYISIAGTIGKTGIIPEILDGANLTENACKLVLKGDLHKKYLYYNTLSSDFEKQIKKATRTTAQPKLALNRLSEIKIPLPPLEEQHRIVSILDASFEKIDALKKNAEENLKNAKALFQQVLVQELKQKEGCEMVKLGDVCELKSGNSSANDSNVGHLAYVKVSDLNLEENKNCIVTSTKFVDRQQNLKNIFPVGSVIFPKRGGAILTNKKRLTSIEVCCDLNIMGVIPCTNLDSHYLFYYFQGLNLGKISSGTTIPQINNKDVSPLLIPLPVIEEQHRIVRTLDTLSEKCRRLETIAQQTIRECDALKQSILRQAFSGEL